MKKLSSKKTSLALALFASCLFLAKGQTFDCNSDLYQVVNGKDLKVLDPATGVYQTVGSSSINYNGAGFNYEDGYIYGVGTGNVLVRIDNTGEATDLGSITGFSAISYSGDLDTLGNWYSFKQNGGSWIMNTIDVSSLPPVAVEENVTELASSVSAVKTNDIAYNSVTNKFYGMHGGILVEFDPFNRTVKGLADYSATTEGGGYGAVWSDVDGNTYFFNNNTGNIYRASFDASGNILSFAFSATSAPNGSNDGMGCPLAQPPVFPEICDNGIDDDGDGLIDCEDPDCTSSETCGISGVIHSSTTACEESISTYHTFFTNNSTISNTITVTEVLPTGFVFLQDTIEFDAGGSNAGTYQPVDGDQGTIKWGPITLEGGETVRISYDVVFNELISNGVNTNNVTIELTTPNTNFFPSALTSDITVGACPTPQVYSCEPAFYQVYKKRGKNQPNMYGRLNPETGDYDPIAVASDYANGLGFDINTGLVYGASGKRFIQLDENGVVLDKSIRFNKNVYRGDINENSKWYGVDGSDMVVIDVSGVPFVEATYPGQGLSGWDIAYNENGNFYSVHNNTLYQFNTTTNQKSTLGAINGTGIPGSGGYGAQWTGSDGYLYISHNSTGKIIRVDIETLEARVVSSSIAGLSKNDGFSCPTELPVVFEYDYGDNSRLPQSRILSYRQDLSQDGIPDYSTFWVGNTVTFDTVDPGNLDADGDLDDGFNLSTEIDNGGLSTVLGLNANLDGWAYHLIGIDWDDNGTFDEIQEDSTYLTGAQTVLGSISVPEGFTEGDINLRVIISEEKITAQNISGDINGMGEVEDYRYQITSPCEGAGCEVPGGSGGGLESNGNLSKAISQRNYNRAKNNYKGGLRSFQPDLQSYKRARTNGMESYFPESGLSGNEEVRVSSPEDLVDLTNATDVFAVDYYQSDRRVAASLLLSTENQVYNHSKNVCDRLNGKSIEEAKLMNVDGFRIIYAKIKNEEGAVEYSAWFSAKDNGSQYEVLSLWAVDNYPEGEYLNFQVWASSPSQIVHILKHTLSTLNSEKEVIINSALPQLPKVLVKSGFYQNGQLHLSLTNNSEATSAEITTSFRRNELSNFEDQSFQVNLNGAKAENIAINTGYMFDAGISLKVEGEEFGDVLYLADGAWGTDYNVAVSTVSSFNILDVTSDPEPNTYLVERGFSIEGESSDVVNVFRNVMAGEQTLSLASFKTLSFDITSTHPIEVVFVEKGLVNWEDRLHTSVPAYADNRHVVLNIEDFIGTRQTEDLEVQSIVFSYLNQTGLSERVAFNVNNLTFGDEPQIIASVEDNEDAQVTIYPNPSSEYVNVRFNTIGNQPYEFRFIDATGKGIHTVNGISKGGSDEIQLNVSDFPTGFYFVKMTVEGRVNTQKLLIRN